MGLDGIVYLHIYLSIYLYDLLYGIQCYNPLLTTPIMYWWIGQDLNQQARDPNAATKATSQIRAIPFDYEILNPTINWRQLKTTICLFNIAMENHHF